MEIKELRAFAQVAETLSFHKAASALNISQPVVTKTIHQLEHRIGVKLFTRTTRRVALTPAGATLRREVDGLLRHFDQVQRSVRHAIGPQNGRIGLGVTPAAMQGCFPKVLRSFCEAHPEISPNVCELSTDAQVRALLSAEIDVGFLLAPVSVPELEVAEVQRESIKLALPSDHPHLQHTDGPLPLSAFAGETFIIPARAQNPGIYDEILRACATSGFRPKVRDCRGDQTCLGLVEAGLGVSFIMTHTRCPWGQSVRVIELEAPAPELTVAVAWRRDDPSPLLDIFRDYVRDATAGKCDRVTDR